ncbi:MAG: aminomethyl-transferring glycine dehydrogenase subunit GcvPA [Candidatus Muiribacteriota bacterium]
MHFFPHLPENEIKILKELNVQNINELFSDISSQNINPELKIPEGMSELEVDRLLSSKALKNNISNVLSFAGAGIYPHYVPSVIDEISGRGEYYTAYTPYQPEVSQGTLQTIYEFQSYICALTGLDVANASMYDGATALAEACLLALANKKGKKIILSAGVHPEYKKVIQTYLSCTDAEIEEVGLNEHGTTDISKLKTILDKDTAAVVISNPNFFGNIENEYNEFLNLKNEFGFIFIGSVNPVAQFVLKNSKHYGFDVVTGEGQPLGMYQSFGGPCLGFFAASSKYARKMPGRIVGLTTDADGKDCFVLTLQAREQHIRRDKATSNICSNQALCASRATMYMSLLGKTGMQNLAAVNLKKSRRLLSILEKYGFKKVFSAEFFNEFTVSHNQAEDIYNKLLQKDIVLGVKLSDFHGGSYNDKLLVCCTENFLDEDFERLEKSLKEVIK